MTAYHAVRSMIQKVALDVGITKRVHPHLFRHTAATALSKKFNEYEFRKFMGWSAKSTTPAEYVHLDDQDIKYAVYAKRFGLVEIVREVETNKILGRCPKCGAVMPTTADICQTCKFIVNQDLRIM